MIDADTKVAVIGLGYVGLPLAVAFAKKRKVLGFDVNAARIEELQEGIDATGEVSNLDLKNREQLSFTTDERQLSHADIFIVTVPTPITPHKTPDLKPLLAASELVARHISRNNIVIFESTVFPGATEDECIPRIEEISGLRLNEDFFCGYSPERINPGDKIHSLSSIVKVTSGSSAAAADVVDSLYAEIIEAGTYKASSIKVAEAAKVIENTQRDLNIALVNELALIFERLNLDTEEVLLAAGTKWNFLPFRPGLVGGHCIGVDPYYLTHKAESVGYKPEVILAGRRVNDGMGRHIASRLIKKLLQQDVTLSGARVLIMGYTFKENCPDIRNTKVLDIVEELQDYGLEVQVFDPWINHTRAGVPAGIEFIDAVPKDSYDSIILAVAHDSFRELGVDAIRSFGKARHILYDLKCMFLKKESDLRL